jgi:hypothetical protein
VGEAQKGRVFTLSSDSSWRWSFGATQAELGHAYQRFWEAAVRWLIRDPSLSFLRIEADQPEYARGQRVALDVRALGPDYQALPGVDVTVAIASQGERAEQVLATSGRTDEGGMLHVELEPPRPGGYRVTARATLAGRPTEEEEVFLVRGAGKELETPEARDDLLGALAKASGGQLLKAPDEGRALADLPLHPPRIERVNHYRDVALWSGWWMLLACAGALAADWSLRRRWGYA